MYLVQPGQERVQRKGKKENTEKVRIMFLVSIWRTLKSESTIPSQYLDKAPIAVITFGAYTSGRIDTMHT